LEKQHLKLGKRGVLGFGSNNVKDSNIFG